LTNLWHVPWIFKILSLSRTQAQRHQCHWSMVLSIMHHSTPAHINQTLPQNQNGSKHNVPTRRSRSLSRHCSKPNTEVIIHGNHSLWYITIDQSRCAAIVHEGRLQFTVWFFKYIWMLAKVFYCSAELIIGCRWREPVTEVQKSWACHSFGCLPKRSLLRLSALSVDFHTYYTEGESDLYRQFTSCTFAEQTHCWIILQIL